MDNARTWTMAWFIQTVLLVPFMLLVVQARIIDISRDIQTVVKVHNDERMSPDLRAANMREMVWDTRLQKQAEQWAGRCLYQRPPRNYGVGSNLYYQRHFVHGHASSRRLIKDSMNSWISHKRNFVYSSHCGSACPYVQMIHTDSNRIGCAVNTCENLKTHRRLGSRGTLFVCLYSPHVALRGSFPYVTGRSCSRCQRGESCVGGNLCSKDESYEELRTPDSQPTRKPYQTPRPYRPTRPYRPYRPYRPQPSRPRPQPSRPRPQPSRPYRPQPSRPRPQPSRPQPYRELPQNDMSSDEMRSLVDVHNNFRREKGLDPLVWDKYLERFCKHVINCSVDYPGPRHAYTNFHRFRTESSEATGAIFDWMRDSNIMPPRVKHKCRTPNDVETCNHYSNIMKPKLTGMACATKICAQRTRQMVCIYDNKVDRNYRLSELRRVRRPTRRWDRQRWRQ